MVYHCLNNLLLKLIYLILNKFGKNIMYQYQQDQFWDSLTLFKHVAFQMILNAI